MSNWRASRKILGAPSVGVGPFIGFDNSRELFVLFKLTPNFEEIAVGISLTDLFNNAQRHLDANKLPKGIRCKTS